MSRGIVGWMPVCSLSTIDLLNKLLEGHLAWCMLNIELVVLGRDDVADWRIFADHVVFEKMDCHVSSWEDVACASIGEGG